MSKNNTQNVNSRNNVNLNMHFSSILALAIFCISTATSITDGIKKTSTLKPAPASNYTGIETGLRVVRGDCPHGVRKRKEIRNLSKKEWQTFVNALLHLQSGSRPTEYDRIVKIHLDIAEETHIFPRFFPWHRALLHHMEVELQKFDPSIMIPYWNWAYDSQAPELSFVFTPEYFGGNGQGKHHCVMDGPFKNWQPFYPVPHCFKRDWRATKRGRIEAFQPVEIINSLLVRADSYDALRTGFETPMHNAVHVSIGGEMPNMHSTNDPIFWTHHGFVDKLWADWQLIHRSKKNDYGGFNLDGSEAKATDDLFSFQGTKVQDVFNTKDLCYEYSECHIPDKKHPYYGIELDALETHSLKDYLQKFTGGKAPAERSHYMTTTVVKNTENIVIAPDDRQHLIGLRIPPPMPEDFLEEFHINATLMRYFENMYADTITQINSLPGYVSPCSLWMREDLTERIIDQGGLRQVFYTHVNHKMITTAVVEAEGWKRDSAEILMELKDLVRSANGRGSLRADSIGYRKALEKLIGPLIMSWNSVLYPYTQPLHSVLDKEH